MKNILLISVLNLFTISLFSQEKLKGNKVVTTQQREVEPFNKIVTKDDFKVYITTGSKSEVTVITDENLQEAITTRVSDGTLEIFYAQKIASSKELLIKVTLPEKGETIIESRDKSKILSETEITLDSLQLIALDRSSHKYQLKVQNITLELDNESQVELNIDAKKTICNAEQTAEGKIQLKTNIFEPNLFNSAELKISGISKNIDLIIQDDAKFLGKDFICDDSTVNASDKSTVEINASKTIYVDVENEAKIYVFNQPKITLNSFKDKAVLYKK